MSDHRMNFLIREMTKEFRNVCASVAMVVRAAPSQTVRVVVLTLGLGSGPAAILYIQKIVIDEVVEHKDYSVDASLSVALIVGMIAFVTCNLLMDSIETIRGFRVMIFGRVVEGRIKERVYHKIATFNDIALFETPELLNELELALRGVGRLRSLTAVVGNLLIGTFMVIPVLVLSASIEWWVPIVIFGLMVPSVCVQLYYDEKAWNVEAQQASLQRQIGIFERILTSKEFAKELRLFGLQSLILDRWKDKFWSAFRESYEVTRRGTYRILFWSLLSVVGVGAPFVYVVLAVLDGRFSVGDLALYVGLVYQVQRSIFILVDNTSRLRTVGLAVGPIFRILNLEPELKDQGGEIVERDETAIDIDGLSFSYPGETRLVLKDINLRLRAGETVAIVGENGAGKTTLVKLLCRLFDPVKGSISWNGMDIREIGLADLRRRIGTVMQDFARFPLSGAENIGTGSIDNLCDRDAIEAAATGAGLREILKTRPGFMDKHLTRELDDGIELSGGEWQRVALARAFMRLSRCSLVILDEPTAALDPKTEYEIHSVLADIAKDKTSVIITHRLSLARISDRIVVLEDGRVVEEGTHEELMSIKGVYSSMFMRQAIRYTDNPA